MPRNPKIARIGEGSPKKGDTFTREICYRCRRESCLGFKVPHRMWDAVFEKSKRKFPVLCVLCFDDLCDEEWEDKIEFFPISRVAFQKWLDSTTHEEKVARFKKGSAKIYQRKTKKK